MTNWTLERDAFGHLGLLLRGERHEAVVPVRAFPIAAPEQGVSIISRDGHELVWIEELSSLDVATRALIDSELASREFIPVVKRIHGVSAFATPSTWQVDTDRGACSFVLRGEEDIRHLGNGRLLIADSHGIQYLVADRHALDKHSRKILDRFL